MKFSESQQQVIDLRNKNILVSAAAGSGKTTVLVERIIKLLINEKEDIDKFLIVTFTNAAASGMKQKIHKALVKALQKSEDKEHLSNQLNLLSKANISTIHAFCIDVVRKNFHVIGIDPSFRIGDVNEVDILLQESIDEVLENHYAEKQPGFIQFVESFTGNRGDLELNEIIKDIYKFILSFPDPLEWLSVYVDMLSMPEDDLKSSMWIKAVHENIILLLSGAEEALISARRLCLEDDGPSTYEEAISEDLNNIKKLKSLLETDFKEFIKFVHSVTFPTLKALKGKLKEEVNIDKQDDVKSLREDYKDIIKNIKKMIPDKSLAEYAHDINYMHPPMRALYHIICDLDSVFKFKKMDKSIADFNDVEHYALQILRLDDIKESYKAKFKYIFIDEYQDSNSLQEELLSQIKRENNLFMVGDVKQSIYRFRLSDPTIFNDKSNSYPVVDSPGHDRRIDLTQNFRSRKEILSSINYVFYNIMNKTIGEVEYDESVFLNPGAEFKEISEECNGCFTELHIIDKNSTDEDLDEEIKSMKTAELEAALAVQKINALLKKDKNEPIRRDKETNDVIETLPEKLQYKDIVILMRSVSGWAGIFEEIFNDQGIPFYFDGGAGYFETIEIQVILNLLRIIDNIRQDIPLLSVMRSTIGAFTTEELVHIRVRNPRYNFIDALYEYKNNCQDELSEKLRNFISKVEDWKKRSRYIHLNDFIWEILMETNYYYFVGLLPNGKIRQANLRLLSDKAFDFEKTSMSGLFNFLRYVDRLKLSSGDSSSAKTLGENDNVVRLMSVHKSKGLEFPVVIMCGTSKKFNKTDASKSILRHKLFGIAPKYINTDDRIYRETLPRTAIKNIIKIENLSEEMRVLYVAMTRAIDRLILIGTVDKFENKIKKWQKGPSLYNIYNEDSFLDWICTALFKNADSDKILKTVGGRNLHYSINYSTKECSCSTKWNIEKITLSQIGKLKQEEAIKKAERINEIAEFKNYDNSTLKDEIDRRLKYTYAYSSSVNIPTKLSVTDLKVLKLEKLEQVKYKIPVLKDVPQFKEQATMFTNTEIGTIVHFVMQHLNLNEILTTDNITDQKNKMVHKRLLTEKEAEAVSSEMLADFFRTDIGKRMLSSSYVKREVPFVIKKNAHEIIHSLDKYDMILIQGIIDCYFYEDDQVVIIDYKTDRIKDGHLETIKQEYSPQILSYKEAVEKISGKKVKACYLYLFDIGQAVEIV
ncbi:MAG: helicase-exonuclease AddAB subunit AddA [Sedimentibacter sp.]